jgi:hypothetical protein
MRFFIICLAILTIQSVNANTSTQKSKHFNNWIAYIEQKGNKKVCYAFTEHTNRTLLHKSKSKAFFVINYLPAKKFTLSYLPGFIIDKNFPVKLQYSNKQIVLNNQYYSFAATYSAQQDNSILDLFIKRPEENFFIKSYRKKNQAAQDYFSLAGLRQALIHLQSHCF